MSQRNLIYWTLRNRSIKEISNRLGEVVVGWIIRPFSFITPRNKRKWIIGNKTGWGDNSKYLRILLEDRQDEDIRVIWIAKGKKERDLVRSKGFESYTRWSMLGVYHALTAGAFFYSSSISDTNYWASGNAFKMNMWHGVGLKKLGRKQSDTYNPKDISTYIFTPFFYNQPTYFIGPSNMMARHFAECYNMRDEQMLKVGYPRCEFLLMDKTKVYDYINRYESNAMKALVDKMVGYRKSYVYMPTYRDDQNDFIKVSGINFNELNEALEKNESLLLLKLHPATRMADQEKKDYSNIIFLDKNLDIYPIIRYADVLITDYSSIYYDFILMPDKEIILFPFDYEDYVEKSRDFAFDYLTYAPGRKAWDFNQLKNIISSELACDIKERDFIINNFWGHNYQDATQNIINVTKKKLLI